jgi:hypothetical protein
MFVYQSKYILKSRCAITKLFRTKKVYSYICRLFDNSWWSIRDVKITFGEDLGDDAKEIRKILDEQHPSKDMRSII